MTEGFCFKSDVATVGFPMRVFSDYSRGISRFSFRLSQHRVSREAHMSNETAVPIYIAINSEKHFGIQETKINKGRQKVEVSFLIK